MKNIEGNIVDVVSKRIFPGKIVVEKGKIVSIMENEKSYNTYIIPGFIDAHVHIESSMLIPQNFSNTVIPRGTSAVLCDPHEIANVLGVEGIEYMVEAAKNCELKIFFGIPSCVPSTIFDKTGGIVTAKDVKELSEKSQFIALSEVMNVAGVLFKDAELMEKIRIARERGLRIDGHAPLLKGDGLEDYIASGITTDHECVSLVEAEEKIAGGMKILIREGSAAQNYEALRELIRLYPNKVMFCTDDSHPDDLLEYGHIDKIVRRAIADGYDLWNVLRAASYNAIKHYGMPVGCLQIGDSADFIRVSDLKNFDVLENYIQGKNVLAVSTVFEKPVLLNKFNQCRISEEDIVKLVRNEVLCIKVLPNEIVTGEERFTVVDADNFESDTTRDILKIVYLNRYEKDSVPVVAYITGFGLKKGAFASTISHDSHNILAVGCSDRDIVAAINAVIDLKGGLSVVHGEKISTLPLPIAGIMSDKEGSVVAENYKHLNQLLYQNGVLIRAPFMTLSFMALIVIPELKIGEQGLFSFEKFSFIES